MGLLEQSPRQGILQAVEGNRQNQNPCFCMHKRLFLVTFDKEDFFQRDVVDSLGNYDLSMGRMQAVLVVCDGKCVHGLLLFVLFGKVFLFSLAIFVIISCFVKK